MRAVVVGGFGNFGARICRALQETPGMEVVASSRNAGARLDASSGGFAEALRKLSPDIVIHCAGPFQGQGYEVVSASLAAGAHYLDLADGREFVAKFRQHNNGPAMEANRTALAGASTLPALSSAVIDSLKLRFRKIEEIQLVIAPGQRAARGAATLAGVFSYAGKPFQWLEQGAWIRAWGWQEMRCVRIDGLGARWAAACDVPDLELLPARFPGVQTVQFRAALELSAQHLALWLAAAMRRAGAPLPIERWARPLDRAAEWLNAFGGDRGGMSVSVTGTKEDGSRARAEWRLIADAGHGPEVPCIAAILLARKLARGELLERGAYPCMGFLTLAEFEPEFARWQIRTKVEEEAA